MLQLQNILKNVLSSHLPERFAVEEIEFIGNWQNLIQEINTIFKDMHFDYTSNHQWMNLFNKKMLEHKIYVSETLAIRDFFCLQVTIGRCFQKSSPKDKIIITTSLMGWGLSSFDLGSDLLKESIIIRLAIINCLQVVDSSETTQVVTEIHGL